MYLEQVLDLLSPTSAAVDIGEDIATGEVVMKALPACRDPFEHIF